MRQQGRPTAPDAPSLEPGAWIRHLSSTHGQLVVLLKEVRSVPSEHVLSELEIFFIKSGVLEWSGYRQESTQYLVWLT
jgi:hypothetical protein